MTNSTGNPTTDALIASGFNQTLLEKPYLCTTKTCPKELQTIEYVPSLGGNAFFLALFAIILISQIAAGIKWKTWSFTGCVFGGLVLEVIGYAARIQIHDNPFKSDPFLMYLVTLTIAPCFLTAAIYLSLSRIILTYGTALARFKPRTYTIIFICCDVFSLVLQAVGGAIADTADTKSLEDVGINIMIAGLVFQVVSLTVFAALCADFFWSVRKHGGVGRSALQARLPKSVGRFYFFIGSLSLATLCIYIRSIFRVAELQGGFNGHLANDEVTFMILEGAMVGIASIVLTLPHPGMVFGQNWMMAKARAAAGHEKVASSHDVSMERLREEPK
ncbi:MAG: hypothetical protein L6R38_006376 [Xanthoria sp. 2 TBL-2021]|nr:MAG: hypothetical protein L6R38_006376 [Xanthoria sp. 2 TBL-2021]